MTKSNPDLAKRKYNYIIITLIVFTGISSFNSLIDHKVISSLDIPTRLVILIVKGLIYLTLLVLLDNYFFKKRLFFSLVSVLLLDLLGIFNSFYFFYLEVNYLTTSFGVQIFLTEITLNLIFTISLFTTKYQWLHVYGVFAFIMILLNFFQPIIQVPEYYFFLI